MLKVSVTQVKVQLLHSSARNRGNHSSRMSSSAVLDLSGTTNFWVWVPIGTTQPVSTNTIKLVLTV